MGRGGYQGWLAGLPADAVTLIQAIQGPPPKGARRFGSGGGWWIRRQPTTRQPREVTLLLRSGGVTMGEWPTVRDGRVLTLDRAHGHAPLNDSLVGDHAGGTVG